LRPNAYESDKASNSWPLRLESFQTKYI
jgi:hypothetical protein